ncbi:MAG: sulfatase-like hydrolase/transferase [Clostridia bacterium]|nr:sulfatase-like hydrolase/transferase [Clostridia bacterium]
MSNRRPNIVFLLNDHQAYYRHGQDGGPKIRRENFDTLAQSGARFTRASSVCPLCGPSRRSMLNGLYPHNHGETRNDKNMPYIEQTYLDVLASSGYKNYYFGKWHAGPGSAYEHHCEGFSQKGYGYPYSTPEYLEYLKQNALPDPTVDIKFNKDDFKSKQRIINSDYTKNKNLNCDYMAGVMTSPKECHEAYFLAHLACEKITELAAADSNEPFHLRVDFWGPHQPYFPTKEFADTYNPKDIPEYGNFNYDMSGKPDKYKHETVSSFSKNGRLTIPNPVPWQNWQEILALCYAQITLVDDAAGLILEMLSETGLLENTMIIYTTDHGDALACHGGHYDKMSYLPEELMRIPMAVSYPGHIAPSQVNHSFVSNLDVAPTILDAANCEFEHTPDGKSLLEICAEKTQERDDMMCESYGHNEKEILVGRVLYWDKYKFVYNKGDMDELYDLDADVFELNNLIDDVTHADVLQNMKERLVQNQLKSHDLDEIFHEN